MVFIVFTCIFILILTVVQLLKFFLYKSLSHFIDNGLVYGGEGGYRLGNNKIKNCMGLYIGGGGGGGPLYAGEEGGGPIYGVLQYIRHLHLHIHISMVFSAEGFLKITVESFPG